MQQQIHVISDAITNYNYSVQALKVNEQKLNDNIRRFNEFQFEVKHAINKLIFSREIADHLNLLCELVNELNEQFDTIISSIMFSKINLLHPSIITPQQLLEELIRIKPKSNLEFPISLQNLDDIHQYFTISTLSSVVNDDLLIFAIKIPLVSDQVFKLYHLIPLPARLNQSSIYSYVDPSFPFLMYSITRTQYGRLRNLQTCKSPSRKLFICDSSTLIHSVNERPVCETKLLDRLTQEIPEDCSTRTLKSKLEIWHRLEENQWLFVVTNPTIGSISCGKSTNNIIDVEIQNTGIFTLKNKCRCYTFSTVLIATSNLTANFTHFSPNIEITKDDCCLKKQEFLKSEKMQPLDLPNLNLEDLRHSQHKLKEFHDVLQQNLNKPFVVEHSHWYNLIIASIITFLILTCCFYYCCRLRCSRHCTSWGQSLVCINSHNTSRTNSLHTRNVPQSIRLSQIGHQDSEEEDILFAGVPEEPAAVSSRDSESVSRSSAKHVYNLRSSKCLKL